MKLRFVLLLSLVLGFAAPAEILYNGIQLPTPWPPPPWRVRTSGSASVSATESSIRSG